MTTILDMTKLPAWASPGPETPDGRLDVVVVDCHAMYPAVLAEMAAHQAARRARREERAERVKREQEALADDHPGKLSKTALKAELKSITAPTLNDIQADSPDRYSLECAYQWAKMKVQVAVGWPDNPVEIRFRDPGKKFAQANHPEGPGADVAASPHGPNEARQHFKLAHGFVPGS